MRITVPTSGALGGTLAFRLSEPGTLLQLRNDSDAVAEVLYIVSPTYVFELDDSGKPPRYDDAVPVADTWEELVDRNFDVPALRKSDYEYRAERAESIRRLAAMKGHVPTPLSDDDVAGVSDEYDHTAANGCEVERLAAGDNGAMTHCRLRAGETTSAVRHRMVEELWFVLDGAGDVWRRRDGESRSDAVCRGDSLRVPVGTSVQARADDAADLEFVIVTMPPSPGAGEIVPGHGGFEQS